MRENLGTGKPIRVLLEDDHTMFREGPANILDRVFRTAGSLTTPIARRVP